MSVQVLSGLFACSDRLRSTEAATKIVFEFKGVESTEAEVAGTHSILHYPQ